MKWAIFEAFLVTVDVLLRITIKLLQQRWLCTVAKETAAASKGLLTLEKQKGSTNSLPLRFLGWFFWVQMCIPLAPMHYNHLGLQIRLVDAVSKRLLRQFSWVTLLVDMYLKNWRQKWRSMNSGGFLRWWWKMTRWALIICCKMKFSRSQFNHSVIKECSKYITRLVPQQYNDWFGSLPSLPPIFYLQ